MSAPVNKLNARPPSGSRLPFAHTWRALRSRNFKLFFAGQSISIIGTWMTRIATSWLVYRLTGSALMLGVVGFVGQIVSFLVGPFAGVWVERLNRRKLLTWLQAAASVQSLTLAALTLTHRINLWEIIVLAVLQGLLNAFDMPARQSFMVQMVDDRDDLGNAIALNSSMNSGARLIGPAIAGLVIAAWGEGICFLADGLSYFAVIASLLMMRIERTAAPRHTKTIFEQMREGWQYVSRFDPVRSLLILFALSTLMGYPFMVLLPVIAVQVLHGGPHTFGWLSAAAGVGTMIAALVLTARRSVAGLARTVWFGVVLGGVALILLGLSHWLLPSLLMMALTGYGLLLCGSAVNTMIQTLVSEEMRARTMSYYTMAFYGAAPVGSLLAGALAQWIGAPRTVMLTGACCTMIAVWFTLHLPRVEAAIQATISSGSQQMEG